MHLRPVAAHCIDNPIFHTFDVASSPPPCLRFLRGDVKKCKLHFFWGAINVCWTPPLLFDRWLSWGLTGGSLSFFFWGGGDVGWQGFPRIPQGSPRESPVSVQSAGGGGGGGKNVTYYVGTWQLTFYRVPLKR